MSVRATPRSHPPATPALPAAPARPRGRAARRLLVVALVLALALVVLLLVGTHAGRTAVRTLLFLPDMFPGAPVRPLTWITPPPRCEEVEVRYADTATVGDLCYPAGGAREGGVVLSLGVHPLQRDDPLLVQVQDGLVRTQMAVLRLQSPDLSAGRIEPREIDALVAAFALLRAHPEVDPARVGLAGFSVGGSLSLVAAADPRIRDLVALVYSFGGYYDALAVLDAIAARRISRDGLLAPWEPHPWSVRVFAEQLIHALPDEAAEEREWLLARLHTPEAAEPLPPEEVRAQLSQLGRLILLLLEAEGPVDSEALLAALPDPSRARFRYLSPATHLAQLRAPVYLMHDVGDRLIPHTESRALAAQLAPELLARYDEFHMFEHVMPRDPAALIQFVPDLVALYQHLYAIFLLLTE